MEKENEIDFLGIGDIVIDAFIKLKDAEISGTPDTKEYKICLPFADKVPYEDVFITYAVGNAVNATVSASRLGLKTALITNIGDDKEGENCLASLKKNNINTEFVKINNGTKTNYHYVLWYGPERTILIKHENYAYKMPEIGNPKWIYFSSINETAFPFHIELADYLETHPNIKFALQPGKFEIKLGIDKLNRLYKRAEIFFCNVEEAKKILKTEESNIKELLKKIRDLGPKIVAITDGPNGAYVYADENVYFIKPYPDSKPPYERTGAGDAFSSTVTVALCMGKDLKEALLWGPINSMSVVQYVGAQEGLLTREKIEEYLQNAPEDYKVTKF